jgi:hypothetical protein
MADIELVIKIPEEEYRWIKKSDKTVFADVASKECMLHAIKTGTPQERWIPVKEVLEAIKSECAANCDGCTSCSFNISGAWFDYCLFKGQNHKGTIPSKWQLDKVKQEKGGVHGQ